MGAWKAYRASIDDPIELYDLNEDIGERNDVAGENPAVVAKIADIMRDARTESELFPLVRKE